MRVGPLGRRLTKFQLPRAPERAGARAVMAPLPGARALPALAAILGVLRAENTPLRFPNTYDHTGVDARGETVFEIPPAPRKPYSTPAHERRGLSVVQVSPKGADISGNLTVLVVGTAFRDFGAHLHRSTQLSMPLLQSALILRVPRRCEMQIWGGRGAG